MRKYLLLTNLIDSYSFETTKEFMATEIESLFQRYVDNGGARIEQVLFFTDAFDGSDIEVYKRNVVNLFNPVSVMFISGHDVTDIQIDRADALAIGGGNMHKLERAVGADLQAVIREQISDGIPYIGWNEGSVFACPKNIINNISSDLIAAVPFQFKCHYNINDDRDSIEEFFRINNDTINYVVCAADKNEAADDEGSGIRIEESNAGLAGTESTAPVNIYMWENEALVEANLTEINLMQ